MCVCIKSQELHHYKIHIKTEREKTLKETKGLGPVQTQLLLSLLIVTFMLVFSFNILPAFSVCSLQIGRAHV